MDYRHEAIALLMILLRELIAHLVRLRAQEQHIVARTRERNGSMSDAEYWRAAWTAGEEYRKATGRVVAVTLYPTVRIGVFDIVVRVLDMVNDRPASVLLARRSQWPNATVGAASAHVFREVLAATEEAQRDPLKAGGVS